MVQLGPWIQVVVAASAVLILLSAASDDLRRANGELAARKEDWDQEQQRKREAREAARQSAEAAQAQRAPFPKRFTSSQSESVDASPDTAPTPD